MNGGEPVTAGIGQRKMMDMNNGFLCLCCEAVRTNWILK